MLAKFPRHRKSTIKEELIEANTLQPARSRMSFSKSVAPTRSRLRKPTPKMTPDSEFNL